MKRTSQFLIFNFQRKSISIVAFLILVFSCSSTIKKEPKTVKFSANINEIDPEFKKYWFNGVAELNSYTIEQQRYGELRKGEAILVFVVEPFLVKELVKNEQYLDKESTQVLKLNFLKKFTTGIYDYSMMTSVFTPILSDVYPKSLKITNTNQEWCGTTFSEFKLSNNSYTFQGNSYFEKENEEQINLKNGFVEDEIWTKIRLQPAKLPIGKIEMIPGTMYMRLMHFRPQIIEVNASITKNSVDSTTTYLLDYPSLKRTLEITFESNSPFRIISWKETYPDGFDENAPMLTGTGKLKGHIISDYWNKHSNKDSLLRNELNLN